MPVAPPPIDFEDLQARALEAYARLLVLIGTPESERQTKMAAYRELCSQARQNGVS